MSIYVISIILSCGLIGAVSANIGLYTVLQKKSLITDAISHSLLPGVMLGFIIAGEKNAVSITICATITGLLGSYVIDWIVSKTKINSDAAIGISLSFFFGLGVVLLTHIQNSEVASQSGLESFLLGNAASMQQQDLIFFSTLGILIGAVTLLLGKEFALISFNADYAQSIGLPINFLQLLLRILIVLTVVAGVQAVGVVLMASCLIAPTIAAKYWSLHLKKIKVLSISIGCFSGIFGALASYYFNPVPTGPLIVIVLSVAAIVSVFLGKNDGIFQRFYHNKRTQNKVHREHLLKSIYKLVEEKGSSMLLHFSELLNETHLSKKEFQTGLTQLQKNNWITVAGSDITITASGLSESKRIVRMHRLWELYLLQRLHLPADHVHDNAEQMEHILTPEMEKELQTELNNPKLDPHQSKIPNE